VSAGPLDERGLPKGYAFKPEYELTPREAKSLIEAGSLYLVDCRLKEEFDYVHIPGSVHIPLDEIQVRADEVTPAAGQQVAVLCHHGVRSMKAALALRALVAGSTAKSIAGGIEAWSLGADTTVKRYGRAGASVWPV
jgi:rhodanese-related sulfurtransferase